MELLRSPEGCPWDRAQTHRSIRDNMLEEAYEAADAIDRGDMDNLKEELGDVLFQTVFHSALAQEAGAFTFDDVVDGVCKKLVFRHPHVFGTEDAADGSQALLVWDARKREEKGQRTAADTLDSVARALPALTRASKLQSKAAKAGFDWKDAAPALDKRREELGELERAIAEGSNIEAKGLRKVHPPLPPGGGAGGRAAGPAGCSGVGGAVVQGEKRGLMPDLEGLKYRFRQSAPRTANMMHRRRKHE